MNKSRNLILLTAFATLVVLAAGWYVVIAPKKAAGQALRTETAAAESTASSLRAQIAVLEQQAVGLPAQQQRLRTFALRMPPTESLPTLIRDLTAAARTAGADIVSLTPATVAPPAAAGRPPAVGGAAASSGAAAAGGAAAPGAATGGTASVGRYSVVPLAMTVSGSYFVLQRFFGALEAMPRALAVSAVALKPGEAAGAGAGAGATGAGAAGATGGLLASITASAYVSSAVVVPVGTVPSTAGSAGSTR